MDGLPAKKRQAIGAKPHHGQECHAEIIHRVLAGDREAFELLAREFELPVYRFLRRMVRSQEDAEDLTQEAFVRIYTHLRHYDPSKPLRPWIFRIASNLAISHLRKHPARTLSEDCLDTVPSADPSPRDQASMAQRREALARAVESLPEDTRQDITMRYQEGLSIREIAEATNRRPGAVKMALHRARLALRGLVSPHRETKKKEKDR